MTLATVPASQASAVFTGDTGGPAPQNVHVDPAPDPLLPPEPGTYDPKPHPAGSGPGSLEGLSAGTKSLVQDLATETVSAAPFTRQALGELGYGYTVPKEYRATGPAPTSHPVRSRRSS